jgi:hypothetical protein
MSLTYGYDLKGYDEMIAAPIQISKTMGPLVLPGRCWRIISRSVWYPSLRCHASASQLLLVRHMPSWVPWFNYESLARIGRELGQKTINEPINFVKNAMACTNYISCVHPTNAAIARWNRNAITCL